MIIKYPPLNVQLALQHLRRDPKIAPLIEKHGAPHFKQNQDSFRALTESIIYQQLTGRAASAILDHFLDLFPNRRFPTPEQLMKVSHKRLCSAGLSNQKANYVHDLATKFKEGVIQPHKFQSMSNEELSAHITQVKGVGQWTADMFLMSALNRPDVLPVGDLGIQKGFKKLFNLRKEPSEAKMIALAKPWQPYRTVASWYLWRAVEE